MSLSSFCATCSRLLASQLPHRRKSRPCCAFAPASSSPSSLSSSSAGLSGGPVPPSCSSSASSSSSSPSISSPSPALLSGGPVSRAFHTRLRRKGRSTGRRGISSSVTVSAANRSSGEHGLLAADILPARLQGGSDTCPSRGGAKYHQQLRKQDRHLLLNPEREGCLTARPLSPAELRTPARVSKNIASSCSCVSVPPGSSSACAPAPIISGGGGSSGGGVPHTPLSRHSSNSCPPPFPRDHRGRSSGSSLSSFLGDKSTLNHPVSSTCIAAAWDDRSTMLGYDGHHPSHGRSTVASRLDAACADSADLEEEEEEEVEERERDDDAGLVSAEDCACPPPSCSAEHSGGQLPPSSLLLWTDRRWGGQSEAGRGVRAEDLGSVHRLGAWLAERMPRGCEQLQMWGVSPGTKRLANLWTELHDGEIILEDGRPPRRTVHVASVRILNSRRDATLVESHQEMEDGSWRTRNRPLSEKMRPAETVEEAGLRGIREELGDELGASERVVFEPESYLKEEEERESFSYPGLMTHYVIHTMIAYVDGLPEDRDFCTTEYESASTREKIGHTWDGKTRDEEEVEEEDDGEKEAELAEGRRGRGREVGSGREVESQGAAGEEMGRVVPLGVRKHFWTWMPLTEDSEADPQDARRGKAQGDDVTDARDENEEREVEAFR